MLWDNVNYDHVGVIIKTLKWKVLEVSLWCSSTNQKKKKKKDCDVLAISTVEMTHWFENLCKKTQTANLYCFPNLFKD